MLFVERRFHFICGGLAVCLVMYDCFAMGTTVWVEAILFFIH